MLGNVPAQAGTDTRAWVCFAWGPGDWGFSTKTAGFAWGFATKATGFPVPITSASGVSRNELFRAQQPRQPVTLGTVNWLCAFKKSKLMDAHIAGHTLSRVAQPCLRQRSQPSSTAPPSHCPAAAHQGLSDSTTICHTESKPATPGA